MNFAFLSQCTETNLHIPRIFIKIVSHIGKLGHEHQFLAIATYISLLNSQFSIVPFVSVLNKSQILWLISEGIYPILFNQLEKNLNIKWNKQYKTVY